MELKTSGYISYDELIKYKDLNKEMHPDLRQFASNLSYKPKQSRHKKNNNNNNNWRKVDQKFKNNWLLDNKINQSDDDKLYSQIKGILNKISESNFNELANDFIQLEIKTKDNLIALVDIIFKKAIVESKFNDVYAKLCYELASYYIEQEGDKIYFRELLLNKCQQMFEESVSLNKDLEEEENETFKFKEHVLGCVKFIGELYNINLLTNKIIYSCFLILISKINLGKAYSIDCICALMETVGKNFSATAKKESSTLFDKFEKLKNNDRIDKKDTFAIMDLLDLKKKNKW